MARTSGQHKYGRGRLTGESTASRICSLFLLMVATLIHSLWMKQSCGVRVACWMTRIASCGGLIRMSVDGSIEYLAVLRVLANLERELCLGCRRNAKILFSTRAPHGLATCSFPFLVVSPSIRHFPFQSLRLIPPFAIKTPVLAIPLSGGE